MGYTKEDNDRADYLISQYEEMNNETFTIEWIGDIGQCNQSELEAFTSRGWIIDNGTNPHK